ncbi:Hypothetical_protein [Hexamita inflata]|uniref:Hypothetical_protein n=1 Tax=Hexamita inflata TaxID=28002 RepID=A0AA86QUZ4_9EUKA|nr:Hypothetical protein HINF_LOCUS52775 [Hexamita inflata]
MTTVYDVVFGIIQQEELKHFFQLQPLFQESKDTIHNILQQNQLSDRYLEFQINLHYLIENLFLYIVANVVNKSSTQAKITESYMLLHKSYAEILASTSESKNVSLASISESESIPTVRKVVTKNLTQNNATIEDFLKFDNVNIIIKSHSLQECLKKFIVFDLSKILKQLIVKIKNNLFAGFIYHHRLYVLENAGVELYNEQTGTVSYFVPTGGITLPGSPNQMQFQIAPQIVHIIHLLDATFWSQEKEVVIQFTENKNKVEANLLFVNYVELDKIVEKHKKHYTETTQANPVGDEVHVKIIPIIFQCMQMHQPIVTVSINDNQPQMLQNYCADTNTCTMSKKVELEDHFTTGPVLVFTFSAPYSSRKLPIDYVFEPPKSCVQCAFNAHYSKTQLYSQQPAYQFELNNRSDFELLAAKQLQPVQFLNQLRLDLSDLDQDMQQVIYVNFKFGQVGWSFERSDDTFAEFSVIYHEYQQQQQPVLLHPVSASSSIMLLKHRTFIYSFKQRGLINVHEQALQFMVDRNGQSLFMYSLVQNKIVSNSTQINLKWKPCKPLKTLFIVRNESQFIIIQVKNKIEEESPFESVVQTVFSNGKAQMCFNCGLFTCTCLNKSELNINLDCMSNTVSLNETVIFERVKGTHTFQERIRIVEQLGSESQILFNGQIIGKFIMRQDEYQFQIQKEEVADLVCWGLGV